MAPAKIPSTWVERVREIVENEPSLSLAAIEQRLAEIGRERGDLPYPSPRSIRRIRSEQLARSEAERIPYRYVRWPESFESGALPWAAAPAMLDELARRNLDERLNEGRPTLRWARRYWQLLQSVPDADDEARWWLRAVARHLASYDVLGGPPAGELEALEGWLAHRAWKPDSAADYERAVGRGRIPRWDDGMSMTVSRADLDDDRYLDSLAERLMVRPEALRSLKSRLSDGAVVVSALPAMLHKPEAEGHVGEESDS